MPNAVSSEQKSSGSGLILAAVAGFALIVFCSLIVFSLMGGEGPSPKAVQAQEPQNLSDPEIQQFQDQLKIFSDPNSYLQDPTKLVTVKAAIQKAVDGINSGTGPFSRVSDKAKALSLLADMQKQLDTIQANVTSNRAFAQQAGEQLLKDKVELDTLFTSPSATTPKDGFTLPINEKDITGFGNSFHYVSKDNNSYPPPGKTHRPAANPKLGWTSYGGYNFIDQYGSASDISAMPGTKIYAPFSGTVVKSNTSSGGTMGIMSSDKQYLAVIMHTTPAVTEGSTVQVGQQVGRITNMGYDHLHFELWVNGRAVWSEGKGGQPNKVIWENQKKTLGF